MWLNMERTGTTLLKTTDDGFMELSWFEAHISQYTLQLKYHKRI